MSFFVLFKQISASSNHFLFFPRHRLLTSNLQKCWMNPMVLWPAEWKCSQFLSLFFLLRPSVRVCGSGCDTHYNAVCRVCVCVCLYVYQLLNWPARSSVVPSGLSLKILAQQLFFSRLQFFRVPHHHHHSAARLFFVFLFLADLFFIIIWWNRVWNSKKGKIEVYKFRFFLIFRLEWHTKVAHFGWILPAIVVFSPAKFPGELLLLRRPSTGVIGCSCAVRIVCSRFAVGRPEFEFVSPDFVRWLVPMAAADACESKTHLGKRGVRIELWQVDLLSFYFLLPMTGSHKRQIVDSARLDFCSLFRFCLVEKCFAIYHFACCRVVKSCCIPALFDSIAHDIPTGTHHPPSLHRLIISKPANVSLSKRNGWRMPHKSNKTIRWN